VTTWRTGRTEPKELFRHPQFVFLRGYATSLVFGFDAAGKITAVAPGSLAGD